MNTRSTAPLSPRRRVLLLTDDVVVNGADGPTARLASTRLRLLVALRALNAAGHTARLVANTTPEHVAASRIFAAADLILVGKVFQDYGDLLRQARAAGRTVCLDVTDDLERYAPLAPMRELVELADAATVASDGLARLVAGWTGGRLPVALIADPFEGAISPPGGRPDRTPLRLLWFGSPANLRHLNAHMPGLAALAGRCPLELTIVSTGAEVLAARYGAERDGALRLRFVEWSPQDQARELSDTDLVLLPGDLEADSGLKSANRLIAAIAAGRFCVASPIPSYRPLRDCAVLADDMAAGIEEARSMPAARLHDAVRRGQALIGRDYSPEVIGRRWVEVLADPGPPGSLGKPAA